jgi:hypothetical protein
MEPTDHISKYADSIRLNDAERSRIRMRLVAHMHANPVKVHSPMSFATLFASPLMRGGAFAFVALLVVVGIEFGAPTPSSIEEPVPMMLMEQPSRDADAPAFTKQANPDAFMQTSTYAETGMTNLEIATSTATSTP